MKLNPFVTAIAVSTLAVGLAGCSPASGSDASAEFPTDDLSIVIPYSPGGGTDTMGRVFGDMFAKELGVGVQFENVPGAAGSTGLSKVLLGDDTSGHTLAFAPVDSITLVPKQLPDIPYKAEDVEVIGITANAPSVLAVRGDAPWNTFEDFVRAAKDDPGAMRIAASSSGSLRHITVAAMSDDAEAEFSPAFFTGGAGEGTIAVLQGSVEAVITDLGAVAGQVEAGEMKVIATSALNREDSAFLKSATQFGEAGFDLVQQVSDGDWAVLAPKDIPVEHRDALDKALVTVLESPEWAEAVESRGLVVPAHADLQETLDTRNEGFDKALPLLR